MELSRLDGKFAHQPDLEDYTQANTEKKARKKLWEKAV